MNTDRKTKIICTIGPSCESREKIAELVGAGMDIMRLNFSHGNFKEHQRRVDILRGVTEKIKKKVATLQDLSGPKIRIGTFKDKMIVLREGEIFTLTTDECEGNEEKAYINYPDLPEEIKIGDFIMLQDGSKKLQVVEIKGNDIVTKIIIGGALMNHGGVNVPGANIKASSLTEKDKKDIKFGIKNNIDFVALSFIHSANDVKELRNFLESGGSSARIIAKIETSKAVENIDAIIEASDGIMIARGDLGIEIPAEEVPMIQKMIIRKCNSVKKFVITATQMLESMVKNPMPTRAEVSDVANAIIDGTDAIMLSEETALGDYPIESVKEMVNIALRTEEGLRTGNIDLKCD